MDIEKEKIDDLKNKYEEDNLVEEIEQVQNTTAEPELLAEDKKASLKEKFSLLKGKIKALVSKEKETAESAKVSESDETQIPDLPQRKKLTDIFSVSTIVVIAIAIVLVAGVGFLFGWVVPVIWK